MSFFAKNNKNFEFEIEIYFQLKGILDRKIRG